MKNKFRDIFIFGLLIIAGVTGWLLHNWRDKAPINRPVVGYVDSGLTGFGVNVIRNKNFVTNFSQRFEARGFQNPKSLNIALQAGTIDIAIGTNSNFVTRANQTGSKLKYIYPVLTNSATIVVRKDSNFNNLSDLKGKKIGWVGLPTGTGLGFILVADKKGISVNQASKSADIRPIDMAPAILISQLEQGILDGIVIFEPFVSKLIATGKYRSLFSSLSDEWEKVSNSKTKLELAGIAVSEKLLKHNRNEIKDIVEGWKLASVDIVKKPLYYLTLEGVGDKLWQGADPTALDELVKVVPTFFIKDSSGFKGSLVEARNTLLKLDVYFEDNSKFNESIDEFLE